MILSWRRRRAVHGRAQTRGMDESGIAGVAIPISSTVEEVGGILGGIEVAVRRGDGGECLELVGKIKGLAAESERNRRRVVVSGAGRALSKTFEAFSEGHLFYNKKSTPLLGEILSALTLMLPLDGEAKSRLGSSPSLNSLVWFLKNGDLSGRRAAILVMKDVVVSSIDHDDQERVVLNGLIKIEGATEALAKLIREPICVQTTKASLSVVYEIVSSNVDVDVTRKFVEMDLVSLLLETLVLVESERGISERALGVLDGLCGCKEGREKAYDNALTVPVLVKKILRVSDMVTELSVSVLWKLICKINENKGTTTTTTTGEGGVNEVAVEALQVGAFQKLLLVLQVGCGEETKDKASELLKLLNLFREKLECIDSMDFKHLKRPF